MYGLGEANRGINKRGYIYVSDCSDIPDHTEDLRCLYAAQTLSLFPAEPYRSVFDYPAVITFDIGYTRQDTITVHCNEAM